MRYLAIDRIISKEEFIKTGIRVSEILINKISERRSIVDLEIKKIHCLTKDILEENVFRLVSIRTPFEGFTPIKFDLIFEYKNLEITEEVDLTVEHVIYLRNNYLLQLPLGHHCEVIVKLNSGVPKLFKLLSFDTYDEPLLGICNKSEWSVIKNNLEQDRKKMEIWKMNNLKTTDNTEL